MALVVAQQEERTPSPRHPGVYCPAQWMAHIHADYGLMQHSELSLCLASRQNAMCLGGRTSCPFPGGGGGYWRRAITREAVTGRERELRALVASRVLPKLVSDASGQGLWTGDRVD